ncbi:hypothetical protein [Novosphingobium malaysiense]|uniref:Glycosyltransferase RgtA/B/C/D-like domain-containing protein n=1 Tax=Novosphingobium malaysiense TaxID=1348853 RepID=A0A0B1ZR00_9SPHN|nr:hypothetical protein [Novosphingobium malaysiense]KHK93026.1 hypothetical protein LK12_01195 [Novosphingobium malaysiense]
MASQDDAARTAPRAAVVVAALLALAIALVWTSLTRGPWYDEFYTQYVTRPDIGWLDALRTSWLADNHPPVFYMLMRATAWAGDIEHHRLVNIAVAAVTAAGGWIVARGEPRLRGAAALLVLLLASNEWTLHAGSELRSYFISLCAGALLSLALASVWMAPAQCGRGRRIVYAVTVFVAFNTHIITTLFSGLLLAPFLATALLCRDSARLRALLPPPFAAGLVFLAVTAFQLPYWTRNTQVFWIEGGLEAAWHAVRYLSLRTVEANLPILLGSAAGGFLLIRDAIRGRAFPDLLSICLLTGSGIVLGLAVLVGIHLVRPILIEKYLVVMGGALAFVMAAACARILAAVPRRVEVLLLIAALLWTGFALARNAQTIAARNSWLGTGRLIARTVAACPETTVHTDAFWNADVMAMSPADNRRVPPWAYRRVAQRLGFRIAPAASRELSQTCPNLFWAEHQTQRRFDADAITRHLRESGFPVSSVTLYRVGAGWVASDRPLPETP